MNIRRESDNTFVIGLIAGGVIGAGLALIFAPRAVSELRRRARASADDFPNAASQGYQDASSRIFGAVDEVMALGQAVRDNAADAVSRSARDLDQFAMAAKTSGRP